MTVNLPPTRSSGFSRPLLNVLAAARLLVLSVLLSPALCPAESLVEVAPADAGLPATLTEALRGVLREAVEKNQIAGAEAMVLLGDNVVYHGAEGFLQKVLQPVPIEDGALFDLASLTKVVVTTTSLMILVERGEIDLSDPVSKHLSDFRRAGYEDITIRSLLTHTSGLPHLTGFFEKHRGKVIYRRNLFDLPLRAEPGTTRVYSDTGMIVAGWVVEEAAGMRLDRFASENIFKPLGMTSTGYNPPYREWTRTAATEYCPWRDKILRGEVHDENAWSLGGVAGHAGLFSIAADLAVFCRMMLQEGEWNGARILGAESVREMITPQPIPDSDFQGLGWQLQEERGQKTGSLISPRTYGHTGFTGTSLWLDPDYDLAVILLTNAVHPSRITAERAPVRQGFHRIVSEAVEASVQPRNQSPPSSE